MTHTGIQLKSTKQTETMLILYIFYNKLHEINPKIGLVTNLF